MAGVREVVDRDELDVGAGLLRGAEEVAADAAEAVDTDANGHAFPSSVHAAAQSDAPRPLLDSTDGAASAPASSASGRRRA